jgi:hypothetical protein
MPRVGFEITIPASERDKAVHALDLAAAVIGTSTLHGYELLTLRLPVWLNCIVKEGPQYKFLYRLNKENILIFFIMNCFRKKNIGETLD